MTDLTDDTGAQPPGRRRVGLLAGVAAAVVILAALGATGGWLLAGARDNDPVADPPASPSPPVETRSPDPTESPTIYPAPSSTRTRTAQPEPGGFPLPDVTRTDFADARRRLRALKLEGQVIFGGNGDDQTVERTEPEPGTTVRPGITVKLYVRGAAPRVTVPNVVGMPCADAGKVIAEHGLTPHYAPKKAGRVASQEPAPPAEVTWNGPVNLSCEVAPAEPSASTPNV